MKYKIVLFTLILLTCFSFVFANNISISSKTAIAMDADSSLVLYNKDINKKIYPASTTKILTAILAIENLDLNKNVVVSQTALNIPWDSSRVYLKKDEVMSVNDLLYCLLLNSGNDAANVLAEAVSGDIQTFVKLMNIKAKEIGCANTNFTNAHGYSDDNHYTTALDMAKIFNYCIKNETFTKIISTKSYVVEKTNKTDSKRHLNNTNRLILKKEDSVHARYYEYCIGGKTGYTDEAGRTLITFAKKDGKTVIVAIFGASSNGSQDVRYTDAINLFEYSFNNYSKQLIAKAEDYNFNYINTDKRLNYSIGLAKDTEVLLRNNQTPNISYSISIDETNFKNFDEQNFSKVPAGKIIFNLVSDYGNLIEVSQDLYLKGIQKYSITNTSNILISVLIICIVALMLLVFLILIQKIKNRSLNINNISRKSRRTK